MNNLQNITTASSYNVNEKFTMHLSLCFEITSVYSTKNISTETFSAFRFSCRNNNVIVTAFLIPFILSGDTYTCFLLLISRYCLDQMINSQHSNVTLEN